MARCAFSSRHHPKLVRQVNAKPPVYLCQQRFVSFAWFAVKNQLTQPFNVPATAVAQIS